MARNRYQNRGQKQCRNCLQISRFSNLVCHISFFLLRFILANLNYYNILITYLSWCSAWRSVHTSCHAAAAAQESSHSVTGGAHQQEEDV